MDLSGKVAIVTGGAKGLGRGICEGLLASKAKVFFVDVQAEQAKATLDELQNKYGKGNVVFQQCDISDKASFESVFKKAKDSFGRLDILVCNAGILDEHNWERTLDINLKANITAYYLATKLMSPGTVIYISSVGAFKALPENPVYSATKAGLVALTRSFGHSSVRAVTGISVNAVCPGGMPTGIPLKFAPYFSNTTEFTVSSDFVEAVKDTEISFVADTIVKYLKDGSSGNVVTVIKNRVTVMPEQELF